MTLSTRGNQNTRVSRGASAFRRRNLGQQRVKAVWCDRQLPDRADPAERIIDRAGDRGARRGYAGFSGTFDTERVEWGRCILEDGHLDGRDLGNTRHQVISQSNRLRLPGGVIHELLEQGGANALRGTAGDLPLDQHRVDGSPDVVANEEALDRDRTTVALDAHLREMHAVGVGHVLGSKGGVGCELAAGAARDCAQIERGAAGRATHPDSITRDGKTLGRGLQ